MTQAMQTIKKAQAVEKVKKVASYIELLRAVRQAMAQGRRRAEQVVEQEKVRTSWEIGKLIDAHVLEHTASEKISKSSRAVVGASAPTKERADYAEQVLVRLAKDLGTSKTELYYMREFARGYPIFPQAGKLSWSHYRELLGVNDSRQRLLLAGRAEKENWGRDELRRELRKQKQTPRGTSKAFSEVEVLTAQSGKVGTYRIIQAKAGPYAGELAIDLGFSNYLSLGKFGKLPFQNRDIISVANGKPRLLEDATESDLFTYQAYIYQVIDGDTFTAVIDLGFGFVTTQTLRLRALDAPEIVTADGREAKKFLEKRVLKPSSNVLIRTTKSDKYDRYLVDVFADSRYVNQELLAKGFATAV